MARYAWIITRDCDPDTSAPEGTNLNATGLTGPRRATDEQCAKLRAGEGVQFRMYDDDDVLMYEGRLLGDNTSEDGFGPLDDFGTPNAGATRIDYLCGDVWETL